MSCSTYESTIWAFLRVQSRFPKWKSSLVYFFHFPVGMCFKLCTVRYQLRRMFHPERSYGMKSSSMPHHTTSNEFTSGAVVHSHAAAFFTDSRKIDVKKRPSLSPSTSSTMTWVTPSPLLIFGSPPLPLLKYTVHWMLADRSFMLKLRQWWRNAQSVKKSLQPILEQTVLHLCSRTLLNFMVLQNIKKLVLLLWLFQHSSPYLPSFLGTSATAVHVFICDLG